MEQESKSMEIQRYEPEGYKDHLGFRIPGSCTTDPEGEYVLYADHAAALKAAQDAIAVEKRALLNANAALREDAERVRVMREALEKAVWRDRSQFQGDPFCVLCGAGQKWAAKHGHERNCALASTAPAAEAGQKEGE